MSAACSVRRRCAARIRPMPPRKSTTQRWKRWSRPASRTRCATRKRPVCRSSPTANSAAAPGSWASSSRSSGIELKKVELQFTVGGEHTASWFGPVVTGKLARKRADRDAGLRVACPPHLAARQGHAADAEHPAFLRRQGWRVEDRLSRHRGIRRRSLRASIATEFAELYRAGCRFVQIDEVALALLCDETIRTSLTARGEDPDRIADLYFRMIEDVACRKARRPHRVDASVPRQLQGPLDGIGRL